MEKDLRRLADEWFSLSPEGKKERHFEHGSRPPEHTDSIIYDLWEHLRPERKPNFEGLQHAVIESPDGERMTLGEFFNGLSDKISAASETTGQHTMEEGGFLMQKKMVSKAKLKELYPHIDFDKID